MFAGYDADCLDYVGKNGPAYSASIYFSKVSNFCQFFYFTGLATIILPF